MTPAQTAFLLMLTRTGNINISLRLAGCAHADLQQWQRADEDFASKIDEALGEAESWLVYQAWRRAIEGVKVPYFFEGRQASKQYILINYYYGFWQKQANLTPAASQRTIVIAQISEQSLRQNWRNWLRNLTPKQISQLTARLNASECEYLLYDWQIWARRKQLPPGGAGMSGCC